MKLFVMLYQNDKSKQKATFFLCFFLCELLLLSEVEQEPLAWVKIIQCSLT